MTKAELTAALLAGCIERVHEGICPVCGKAFSAPHKRMTCGEAHCSRTIGYCNREAVAERQRKHEERTRRGVLQNKTKVKRIQEIFASGQDVVRRILFCSESEEVTLSVEGSVIHELAGLGLTNIIGGFAVQNQKVRRVAEIMRERLEKFRAEFVAR